MHTSWLKKNGVERRMAKEEECTLYIKSNIHSHIPMEIDIKIALFYVDLPNFTSKGSIYFQIQSISKHSYMHNCIQYLHLLFISKHNSYIHVGLHSVHMDTCLGYRQSAPMKIQHTKCPLHNLFNLHVCPKCNLFQRTIRWFSKSRK